MCSAIELKFDHQTGRHATPFIGASSLHTSIKPRRADFLQTFQKSIDIEHLLKQADNVQGQRLPGRLSLTKS